MILAEHWKLAWLGWCINVQCVLPPCNHITSAPYLLLFIIYCIITLILLISLSLLPHSPYSSAFCILSLLAPWFLLSSSPYSLSLSLINLHSLLFTPIPLISLFLHLHHAKICLPAISEQWAQSIIIILYYLVVCSTMKAGPEGGGLKLDGGWFMFEIWWRSDGSGRRCWWAKERIRLIDSRLLIIVHWVMSYEFKEELDVQHNYNTRKWWKQRTTVWNNMYKYHALNNTRTQQSTNY